MAKQSNDVGEAIMLSMRGAAISGEALQAMLREYLNNRKNIQSEGKTTLAKLAAEAGNKLDNIKISDKNIGDFIYTARKYGISFALKRDSNTNPPTWFVFFKQDKGSKDAMERAFREYANKQTETPIITTETFDDIDIEMPHEKDEPAKEQNQEFEMSDLPDLEDMPEPELEF